VAALATGKSTTPAAVERRAGVDLTTVDLDYCGFE
jgi:hypothetical protein